ncbi:hypothetical protein N7U66_09220 [Lacinutrix neustonica]|uniref:Uncharacterized protein n=1 Tax=Lacinutrix neustonica TaxID=2980107 RepID=A0A9E8MZS1_9FLAO|nr:hypothetical protein N7U66_09220 [Lacinutrix neustonica]
MIFPKYFNWNVELKTISLVNRQIMTVHTFFIALTLFLIGALCFTSALDLINTKLGHSITFGLGVFWSVRLFVQFFVYSPKLRKGKTFETIIHIIFSLLWLYFASVFLMIYFK